VIKSSDGRYGFNGADIRIGCEKTSSAAFIVIICGFVRKNN